MAHPTEVPAVSVLMHEVFGPTTTQETSPFVRIPDWTNPVIYFVGRNGSGKTRAAKKIAEKLNTPAPGVAKLLATDRLFGLVEQPKIREGAGTELKGFTIDDQSQRQTAKMQSRVSGTGLDDIYAITDRPEILIRVAAFMRRALGRFVDMREKNGRVDPYIIADGSEYSLLRDEGHGLREVLILLTATYRDDWRVLIVDEPEIHLHPALARMWLSMLEVECRDSGRNAIIITHEPDFVKPQSTSDLDSIWFFNGLTPSVRVSDLVLPAQTERINSSFRDNPRLLGQLVFSPRPVLVEGPTDSAALAVAVSRLYPANPEVPSQTDFVVCGGCTQLALWFEIARKMGIDFRAVADLDALFVPDVQRVMDCVADVGDSIAEQFKEPSTSIKTALAPISQEIGQSGTTVSTPQSKAKWLAERLENTSSSAGGQLRDYVAARAQTILSILRDNGLWLFYQGTLEDVLDITVKDIPHARAAASRPGSIDEVANWAAFEFDLHGDVADFLRSEIERIAQTVQLYLGRSPHASMVQISAAMRPGDHRLVDIAKVNDGEYRITVKGVKEFSGYWVEFSRETAPAGMTLKQPT
jgi:AAA domain, putative AbiEii toxin, Type IV TA system